MDEKKLLEGFYSKLSLLHTLEGIFALLDWDQQVMLPPEASEDRGKQLAYVESLRHQKLTSPDFIRTVAELYQALDTLEWPDKVNVRETHRTIERQIKLPEKFVARKAIEFSASFDAWSKAMPKGDYAAVAPHLEKIVAINKEEAELVGYTGSPYNALLDVFEPGMTIEIAKPVLLRLGEALSQMLPEITRRFENTPALVGTFPEEKQYELCKRISLDLGFTMAEGRLDKSAHPFSTRAGNKDHRITVRYIDDFYLSAVYSVIHETGHSLYEMGLPERYLGTPMGTAVSLGIHESQSRFFENIIGRSRAFCSYLYNVASSLFPEAHSGLNADDLWMIANKVQPSLVRIEADEVSYSLHIVIRMLLEEKLISGELTVKDLPAAWDEMYEKYLGLRPKSPREGVMQDVHWYSGMLGYFPTYALGNIYGASMLGILNKDLPGWPADVKEGNFKTVLHWLRTHVHEKGMQLKATELIKEISGHDLDEKPFLFYLRGKFLE